MTKKTRTKKKFDNLPMILIILDGWGITDPNRGNPIYLAKTPILEDLMEIYPSTQLKAHGKYVGLPDGQVGNSEAGHMNIGAGRLVEQDAVKITKSINNKTFFKNSAFLGAIRHVRKMKSKLHIIGMLSNGMSPHSDPDHLLALLALARSHKVDNVFLHLFTDGRDSPKYASLNLVDDLENKLIRNEQIATIMGRFYAMDRKKKWIRTQKAYEALTKGKGRKAKNAQAAITESYNRGDSDEFIEPYIIENKQKISSRIEEGDSVIFINLRSDRSRQLAKAFIQNEFNNMNPGSFKREKMLQHLYFVAMTDFGPDLDDILTAFPSVDLTDTLPMLLGDLRQLYIAETEKYAHVTYFFNGGYSGTVVGEEQYMVPSPDVKSYDLTPTMSSQKLTKEILNNLKSGKGKNKWEYDFVTLNYAAPDMVGHTGNIEAATKCCKAIDKYVGTIVKAYLALNGTVLITADHGNIEKMLNLETGEIYTQHTTNPVPFILINSKMKGKKKLKENGILGDIAPTILKLIGINIPKGMKGKPLI
jgi:2,3-bisphosphoglycerate-independent phosphoglycerate mutase